MQYSLIRHFGEIVFFWKYGRVDYSSCFHKKFIFKKIIIFVKLNKQNVIRAYLPGSPRKSYVPHTTFLEFWLLFQAPFLVRINFLAYLKQHTFLHFFIKLILKKWITFMKLKKQNVAYVGLHEFSWFAKKVIHTTYVVLGFFASPAKWWKCAYNYISLTQRYGEIITVSHYSQFCMSKHS